MGGLLVKEFGGLGLLCGRRADADVLWGNVHWVAGGV